MEFFSTKRLILLLSLMLITPLGFLTKFYTGPADTWINNSLGGLLYEIFWCSVFAFIFVRSRPVKIATWVLIITCILEFLQLWHPSFLKYLRANFIGRTILGNSFNWTDFPYYFVGSFLGYLLLVGINKIVEKSNPIHKT
jgi:hypothetical protein